MTGVVLDKSARSAELRKVVDAVKGCSEQAMEELLRRLEDIGGDEKENVVREFVHGAPLRTADN